MTATLETTIRDIVADDFRAASVFHRHGIDFCCRGGRSVEDACREQGVDPRIVMDELAAACAPGQPGVPRFASWDTSTLVAYIVDNHHAHGADVALCGDGAERACKDAMIALIVRYHDAYDIRLRGHGLASFAFARSRRELHQNPNHSFVQANVKGLRRPGGSASNATCAQFVFLAPKHRNADESLPACVLSLAFVLTTSAPQT